MPAPTSSPDGRTRDVNFSGYQISIIYTTYQVIETDTAVTFSVAGTRQPGFRGKEDSQEQWWTAIALSRALGGRFVISSGREPLIVASASPGTGDVNTATPEEKPLGRSDVREAAARTSGSGFYARGDAEQKDVRPPETLLNCSGRSLRTAMGWTEMRQ